jgi:geranylgeranylglycerol-phosphate geranylgeranyltransferase
MLKDNRDVKGDGAVFAGGIAAVSGKRWFLVSARIIAVVAGVVSVLPYVLGYCKHIYLATSVIAIVLMILSTRQKPVVAIRFIYVQVFLVTLGSLIDLLVYGP